MPHSDLPPLEVGFNKGARLSDKPTMQLICTIDLDPEQYVAESFHKRMRPPAECPHCSRSKSLLALGYYGRNLSRIGLGALLILDATSLRINVRLRIERHSLNQESILLATSD